jgi:hypothetical protein
MFKMKNQCWWCVVPLLLAVGVFSYFGYLYFHHWQHGFSSDTALIGLMAKSILETGERPLFVWSVGYQGMILEGYTSALFFNYFGISPQTLSLSPIFYFALALAVWFCLFWRWYGSLVAALVLLFLASSRPDFYLLNMRTLPNFPQALLIGGLIFLMFEKCLTEYEKGTKITWVPLLLLGFFCGFGIYTFAITIFFIMTIFLVVGLVHFRLRIAESTPVSWQELFLPLARLKYCGLLMHRLNVFCLGIASTAIFFGFFALFWQPDNFFYRGKELAWQPILLIIYGLILLVAPYIIVEIYDKIRSSILVRRAGLLFCCGFFLGYLPSILFKLLGGKSKKKTFAGGDLDRLIDRGEIYLDYIRTYSPDTWNLGLWTFGYFLLCSILVLGLSFILLKKYLRAETPAFPRVIFSLILMSVVLGIFLISRAVVDYASQRYLVLIMPILAFFLVYGSMLLWQRWWLVRPFVVLSMVVFFSSGFLRIQSNALQPPTLPFSAIIEEMQKRSLTHGYADYWLAYASNFLASSWCEKHQERVQKPTREARADGSPGNQLVQGDPSGLHPFGTRPRCFSHHGLANESIILEPLYTNYAPQYGPLVKKESKIAYWDYYPGRLEIKDGRVEIESIVYQVVDETKLPGEIILRVLSKDFD